MNSYFQTVFQHNGYIATFGRFYQLCESKKMKILILLKLCLFIKPARCHIFSLPHKMAVLFYYEEDLLRFLLHAQKVSSQENEEVQAYISGCKDRLREVPALDSKEQQVVFLHVNMMSVRVLMDKPQKKSEFASI